MVASQSAGGGHIGSNLSRSSQASHGGHRTTAIPVELPNGNIRVGKINYNPMEILGKGCEGTFVYK